MSTDEKSIIVETVPLRDLAQSLSQTGPFKETSFGDLSAALKNSEPTVEPTPEGTVARMQVPATAVLIEPDQPFEHYARSLASPPPEMDSAKPHSSLASARQACLSLRASTPSSSVSRPRPSGT
jgi:hypothetical protein